MAVIPSGTSEPWVWSQRIADANNQEAREYMRMAAAAAQQERTQEYGRETQQLNQEFQAGQTLQSQNFQRETQQQNQQYQTGRENERTRLGFVQARAQEGDPEAVGIVDGIIRAESGGNPTARNPQSTATGLGQFIDGTWRGVVNSPEGRAAGLTMDGRTDPEQSRRAVEIHAQHNARILQQHGLQPNAGNIYFMHFLGQGGGPRFLRGLQQDPNMPATMYVEGGQVRSNRSVFFNRDGSPRTAGQVYALMSRRVGGSGQVGEGRVDPSYRSTMRPRRSGGGVMYTGNEDWGDTGAGQWTPQEVQSTQAQNANWNSDGVPAAQPTTVAQTPEPERAPPQAAPPAQRTASQQTPPQSAVTGPAVAVPQPRYVRGPDGRPQEVRR